MKIHSEKELTQFAKNVRQHILKMSTNGGCFAGASLSMVELVTYLYNNYMNISKELLVSDERDFLFLSKGHAVPALYGAFAELGWLDAARFNNHLKIKDDIYWHPNTNIPGIEFHSGSLGHALPISVGVALSLKIDKINNKVIVILGDGELNEGSNWEAVMVAASKNLDNLIIIIDRNKFQANLQTEHLLPIEPIADKFLAFNCGVRRINGHSFEEIRQSLDDVPYSYGKPSVIIADTIRGKGIKEWENQADKWFCNISNDEYQAFKKEIA
ncbi:MAG: thiamine pyrophosphate-dependent enzyme [Candidatus Kapabacteria bacterium]|nr:thiamine pyrophosphate-dependent enzyme [Candidatus Kapabacteria bacterium]